MSFLLDCPVCGAPLRRPTDDPSGPLDCANACRKRLTEDEWILARWHQIEANQ